MSAPASKRTGESKRSKAASARKTPGTARSAARRVALVAESGNNATLVADRPSSQSKLPKPPQGHGGYERKITRKPPRRDGTPPRYTNLNSKQLMLEAAREAAEQRGYEAMRISEITDAVGVTRQAFYAHFRDKRHCLSEVVDPKLAAIERMAASASEQDAEWAARVALLIDDVIAEHFGSPEGTRGRLVRAMIELLRKEGSFHKVRIGTLVKAAHVPPGDFYRQFSGKQECFAVAYEQLLDELVSEVREQCPAGHTGQDVPALLGALAAALSSDPERRHILVVEMAHLPDVAPDDVDGARKSALVEAIAGLLGEASATDPGDPHLTFAAASVVEVIRSAELAGETRSLPADLLELMGSIERALNAGPSATADRLAA